MEMQGNATEIDERNLLQLDALLSHGYGLSPQLVMRSKGLSIEAKALYGYLSSFAGAGDTAFPSTSRILEELDISKNRFYKIRKELISWGFISIETTATSAGLRTVYTLPQNPIAIKTEIDEIANRRADAQKKAGKPVSLGLKTARYPDGVEIDGEMVALEDLAADINVRKTNPLPKSPEEYRGATEQSFDGNEWVNFRFFPDLVDLSKSIDPDTARTDYRADVTSEIAGRNCSFTLHLAKWQYDKAVKAQNQNSPIHIGMKLKYIKGGVIPVQFEGEQFTHNYSPKKLEESLPKVQKARSVSGCRQGKGNRVSSYQDRSYRFKTKEAYEHGLPGAHESRN